MHGREGVWTIRRPFLTPFRHEFGGRTVNMGIVEHTIAEKVKHPRHFRLCPPMVVFPIARVRGHSERERRRHFPLPQTPINPTSFPSSSSSSTHSSFPQSLSREKTFRAATASRERGFSPSPPFHTFDRRRRRETLKKTCQSPHRLLKGGGDSEEKEIRRRRGHKRKFIYKKRAFYSF